MDIQCYKNIGKHLKMMQPVGLPDHVLNMRHGIEEKETLGLVLGVGTNLVIDGNASIGVSHNFERGEPFAWQMNTGVPPSVCAEDQRGVVGHASHMTRTASECNLFEPKESEGSVCQERIEMKALVEDVKVETELWRMESMEGMQVIEESRMPDQPVVEEGEKWVGLENESIKVHDWYKHGCQERDESEQPKEALVTSKCSWQATYQECQRNIMAEKGTTVLDGCGEFMPAVAANEAEDSLNCAACGCHRSFHRRAIRSGGDMECKEKESPENVEALSSICEIAASIRAGAGRALSLFCQDQQKLKVKESASTEDAILIRSCIEALGHNAKAMLASAECLAFLLKPSEGATTCSQRTGKTGGGLPALVPPDEMIIASKLEAKVGSPALIFASETCPQAPFFATKMSWQQGSFCAMDRAVSENSLNGQKRKRKRTRFTFEQLRKLNDFATRTGWTLAGVSKEEVDALCADVGIESVTLKYWIHNTRQKSRKKLDIDTKSPTRTP